MPKVSLFKNYAETTYPDDIEFIEYLEMIRDGKWEDIFYKCVNIKDSDEQKAYKATLPTCTMSGTFSERSEKGIIDHSGYIAMDYDDGESLPQKKNELAHDKYVLTSFISVGGKGLRIIFKIEAGMHREAFKGICNYLFSNYGIICEQGACASISKPYIVSYDPSMIIKYDGVQVFKEYIKEKPVKQLPSFVHTNDDFNNVVKQIVGRATNICESYDDWLKVAFAISQELGEGGRDAFYQISQFSPKYKEANAKKQYDNCLKSRGTEKVNISSFYYLAKQANISIVTERTRQIVRATRNGKRVGLKKEQITENLKKFHQIDGAENLVEKILESPDKDDFTDDESSIIEQLEMFLVNNYNIEMNEVSGYLEDNGQPLPPSDLNSIYIAAKKVLPKLDYQLLIRLLKSDFIKTYNPFYRFFDSDGIAYLLPAMPVKNEGFSSPLIDRLAETIKNDNPGYTLFFLRKWLVSIISAMHKVHSPLLLCLVGPQNSGKTEFLRRLLPNEFKGYYAESKLDKEKDDELLMTENIIIMDDELGGKSKSDSQKLKNLTSKQYFSLRRPYGDHNEKILRLAVLCGTSNLKAVITDTTGNRRIIPIEVTDVNKDDYNEIDKKELFKECFRLYKEGFDWRITHQDIKYLNVNEVEYEMEIKERELVNKYYDPVDPSDEMDVKYGVYLSSTEILIELEKITQQKLSLATVGKELDKLGFERKSVRISKTQTPKKWWVKRNNVVSADTFDRKEIKDLPF